MLRRDLDGYRFDRDKTTHLAAVRKLDDAINLREQGVIGTATDVLAGLERCAALTYEDRTPSDNLATKTLYAQPLCIGVTAIFGASQTFLMCHCFASCSGPEPRIRTAETVKGGRVTSLPPQRCGHLPESH